MQYVKIENGVVSQRQPNAAVGFVEAPDVVLCGFLYDGQTFTPPPPPVKSPEELQAEIVAATQQRLDDFAKTRNYDSILSAASYATDPDPKFAVEGQYAVQARSSTWKKLYEILAEVEAGTRPVPTGYADIESELPTLEWPAQ